MSDRPRTTSSKRCTFKANLAFVPGFGRMRVGAFDHVLCRELCPSAFTCPVGDPAPSSLRGQVAVIQGKEFLDRRDCQRPVALAVRLKDDPQALTLEKLHFRGTCTAPNGGKSYCGGLILAIRMTLAHFSVSVAMNLPNWAGEFEKGV